MTAWAIMATLGLFALGTVFGTLFAVIGIRLPRKVPVWGKISCSSCGLRSEQSFIRLLPVIRGIQKSGECKHCHSKLFPSLAAVEWGTGALFAVLPFLVSLHSELWIAYPLAGLLMILTVSDLNYRLLPNKLIYPAILGFMILRIFIHPLPIGEYALGFLSGGGLLLLVSTVGEWLGKPAMGGGDIKLMALVGLTIGFKLVLLTIFLSALFGGAIGLALIAAGRIGRSGALPYGPFIAAGGLLSMFFGNAWIAWYLGLFTI